MSKTKPDPYSKSYDELDSTTLAAMLNLQSYTKPIEAIRDASAEELQREDDFHRCLVNAIATFQSQELGDAWKKYRSVAMKAGAKEVIITAHVDDSIDLDFEEGWQIEVEQKIAKPLQTALIRGAEQRTGLHRAIGSSGGISVEVSAATPLKKLRAKMLARPTKDGVDSGTMTSRKTNGTATRNGSIHGFKSVGKPHAELHDRVSSLLEATAANEPMVETDADKTAIPDTTELFNSIAGMTIEQLNEFQAIMELAKQLKAAEAMLGDRKLTVANVNRLLKEAAGQKFSNIEKENIVRLVRYFTERGKDICITQETGCSPCQLNVYPRSNANTLMFEVRGQMNPGIRIQRAALPDGLTLS
jgi:hypothetical protein